MIHNYFYFIVVWKLCQFDQHYHSSGWVFANVFTIWPGTGSFCIRKCSRLLAHNFCPCLSDETTTCSRNVVRWLNTTTWPGQITECQSRLPAYCVCLKKWTTTRKTEEGMHRILLWCTAGEFFCFLLVTTIEIVILHLRVFTSLFLSSSWDSTSKHPPCAANINRHTACNSSSLLLEYIIPLALPVCRYSHAYPSYQCRILE